MDKLPHQKQVSNRKISMDTSYFVTIDKKQIISHNLADDIHAIDS